MIKTNGQGFPDNMDLIFKILETGGLVLHPSDTLWMASAALPHASVLDRIPNSLNNDFPKKVLLLRDISMLKQYIVDLHPRIETLIYYLERPVIIMGQTTRHFPDNMRNENGQLACCITKDPFCLEMIRLARTPIVGVPMIDEKSLKPLGFEHLSSNVISVVDYVSSYGRYRSKELDTCPVIGYDQQGNIKFVHQ